ncbi:MAG: PAS domain-containing sensor histidine kinase, partial [Kordiimonas sp.]
MGFNRFSVHLAFRLILVMISLLAIVYLFVMPGFHATTFLMACIAIGQTAEVFRFVSKTNAEVTRFLDAARYADFSQQFKMQNMGAGFGELGEAFTVILERFKASRTGQEEELRHLKALIEHVPVPLMSLHADGHITLWNNAARRLFGSAHVTNVGHLDQFGEEFAKQIISIGVGDRRLATFSSEGSEQQITIASTQIVIGGSSEKLVSLQDIQSELDVVQLQAWQDLVRVLTHEIMNSITPVASLAKTAVDLVNDVAEQVGDAPELVEELGDVKDAVNTVARRSDSLMQFVSSYRSLTRLPPPVKSTFKLSDLFEQVTKLAAHEWHNKGIDLATEIEPSELDVSADRDMVEQILINMLQNAAQALAEQDNAAV